MSKQDGSAIAALKEFLLKIEGDPHPLQAVFDRCVEQAASGKGEERHGKGREFYDQPWVELTRGFGIGGPLFQASKKLREALGMYERGDLGAFEREVLGAINYAAMAVLFAFVIDQNDGGDCANCEVRNHEG